MDETIRFQRQKCQFGNSVVGCLHNFSIEELNAWLGLTLAMGLVKKTNLKNYWSSNLVIKTPLFSETMCRDHYLAISGAHHLSSHLQDFNFRVLHLF